MLASGDRAGTEGPEEQAASPPASGPLLVCVSGPDQGKRLQVDTQPLSIGRATHSNLLSDDPDVAEEMATVRLDEGRIRVQGLAPLLPYVDGHPVRAALLTRGQQVRLGRSLWEVQVPGGGPSRFGFVNRMGDRLASATGIEAPDEWNARDMFAEVATSHADEDVEAYFTVGTPATTPTLIDIDAQWPRPWVFVRVFALTIALYIGFGFAWNEFANLNLIPGLIMIGSVAVPLSLLIFFFEVNVPRNISLYQVIKLVLTGGLVSIIVSLFFFEWTAGLTSWIGAASAGIIEEAGKALTLLLVVNRPRYRWTLNGLLLGATVGTGFAAFESAGYALRAALGNGGIEAMRETIIERGVLTVLGGHVLWTALVGAALWRVRGDEPFNRRMLADPRFLRVFAVCVVMHMLWNSSLRFPLFGYYGKYMLLGLAAWSLVLGMIQSGLKQIRLVQMRTTSQAAVAQANG
jgi:RsiW-degrading membrane proteinase PrsW (M82 family)